MQIKKIGNLCSLSFIWHLQHIYIDAVPINNLMN